MDTKTAGDSGITRVSMQEFQRFTSRYLRKEVLKNLPLIITWYDEDFLIISKIRPTGNKKKEYKLVPVYRNEPDPQPSTDNVTQYGCGCNRVDKVYLCPTHGRT